MHLQWNCVHRTQRTLLDPLVHLARPLLLWPMGSLLVSAFRPLWTVDSVVCVLAYPVPIVLRIKIRAESWARNGNNMFLSCSHHVPIMFPSCLFSQQEDQRAGLIPCLPSHDQCAQAPEKNQSYTCHQLPVFAVIALLRAMKTDARKGWQQTLKSCRGRYVT